MTSQSELLSYYHKAERRNGVDSGSYNFDVNTLLSLNTTNASHLGDNQNGQSSIL